MKKLIYFAMCICLLFQFKVFPQTTYAKADSLTYAKAASNCVLYKSSGLETNLSNIYFVIPETYFMTVLEIVSDKCMKVNYDGYVGFVDSSTAVIATFVPIVKSLKGVTFDIKETSGTQVWSMPSTDGDVLTKIQAGEKSITYISYVYGVVPRGGESNIWYYVSYTPESNSTNVYEGYIYSENATNLSEIFLNAESNPEPISSTVENEKIIMISPSVRTLLVALISVPIILFIAIVLLKIVKNVRKFREKRETFAKNENLESEYSNEYATQKQENFNLKNQIESYKGNTFIRKKHLQKLERKSYPMFPSYDSDDDLL